MSDNWIQFTPHDPRYQPSRQAAESARELLSSLVPDADEVVYKFSDTVEVIHPGGNWSGVKCPTCGALVEGRDGCRVQIQIFEFGGQGRLLRRDDLTK